ncbi:hypothetical protein QTP86_033407 [Hemibagrus guttatus]|nr:hypothetical protein QTP86_033407 [Hemibagrus guttatus]
MSNSGTLQRRTTYLISLTLVKVEAIGSDEGTNEETKPQSPISALGPEDGAQTKEEETKPSEEDKEPGRSEMKEQKVEIKKPSRSNNGCPVRTLPPKPKVLSYPPVVSQYKARELQKDVPLDGKEKRDEEMTKTDVSKMDIYKPDFYIPSSDRTSDDVVSNGTSVRPSVPIRLIQRPETALRPHATVTMNRREFKDASKIISSSAKSLEKAREHSPPVTITMTMGPYRASWSESEGRGMYQRLAMEPLMVAEEGLPTRESPRVEKLKTISTSLPAPTSTRPPVKPQRKGKSRTLDNSDLNLLSEDLKKGKEAHVGSGLRSAAHAPGKDRKMLKFISGIFTKSSQCPVAAPVVPATPIPLHSPLRRRSSEEEGQCAVTRVCEGVSLFRGSGRGRVDKGSGRGGALSGGALRGGALRGGPLRGGALRSGALRGGNLSGGALRDEALRGGDLSGGDLKGGALSGGALRGGDLIGGALRSGALSGGALSGGALRGGDLIGGALRSGALRGGALRGGDLSGGDLKGGALSGGALSGGDLIGGALRSGALSDGTLRGGDLRGGALRGGDLSDGDLIGGALRNGTLRGGDLSGGDLKGGALSGGALSGGTLRGGDLIGGALRSGELIGGALSGTLRGGELIGGALRGGELIGGALSGTLRGGDLSGGDLKGGALSGGALRGGALSGGDLIGGALRNGALSGGTLRGGDLSGGALSGGDLSGGTLRGGDLRGGDLSGGDLKGGALRSGALSGGTLSGGALSGGDLSGGDLSGGDLSGGTLRSGALCGGDLSGGDLSGGDLSGGALSGGDLSGGDLRGGDLSGGDLSGGDLIGGDLSGGALSGGDLSGGALSGGALSGGDLSGGDLSGGDLSGGTLRSGALCGGALSGGALSGGDLRGGDLSGGTLRAGDLIGGDLIGGALRSRALSGGALSGGTLRGGALRGGALRGGDLRGGALMMKWREFLPAILSQEWILSRALQDLHLGVLGSLRSGKSALVHRYMTGRYLALETPEVCRFEKEVLIDGQNHNLLIRDEPGLPDAQLCSWLDGVILVFSLENESSFLEVYNIYRELCVNRNIAEIPFIVVGTQDKITSANPRVIDDARARQLCSDVHRCVYYETCATYGLNVNRVFTDAAQKMVSMKRQLALYTSCKSLPNSPSHSGGSTPLCAAFTPQASNGGQSSDYSSSLPSTPVITHKHISLASGAEKLNRTSQFTLRRGSDSDQRSTDSKTDFGIGRTIPIKQSVLLKRSGSSLKQEWKKKYVTLTANGTLSYHANVSDYMQNVNGKEIDLLRVTVKVPGKRPPRAVPSSAPPPGLNGTFQSELTADDTCSASMLASAHLSVDDGAGAYGQRAPFTLSSVHNIGVVLYDVMPDIEGVLNPTLMKEPSTSPTADRKKQRRKKNGTQRSESTLGHAEDDENCEFLIVSSSGQTWHFEAQSSEERDSWVQNIENQILASLQSCESSRHKARRNSLSEAVAIQAVRNAKGNSFCVDCDAPNPTWASLNLGALICIECSGIHRNLGTHLSRVRSLDLDDWPYELTMVLIAIGNHMTNSIWEKRTRGRPKPRPDATREEREAWIRGKYEQKLFLAPLSSLTDGSDASLSARLHAAVIDRDLPRLLLLLAYSTKEEINAPPPYMIRYGNGGVHQSQTALHAACQLGDVVMTQLLIWVRT